jgi:hypothetical protein
LEHLRALHRCLDLTGPRDAAIWAAALTAFWGCRRLGELLIKSLTKFSLVHDVTRSTRISRRSVNLRLVISFHLPWTKTTGILGGDAIITATGDDFCPAWALDNHFSINHSPGHETPMFSYRDGTGWSPIIKQKFLDFTSKIFKEEKLENVFGHSYRIGGSLKLLLDGVAPEVVMKVGGCTSLCFLIYWRRLEHIIPLAITRAWDAQIRSFANAHGLQHDTLDIGL